MTRLQYLTQLISSHERRFVTEKKTQEVLKNFQISHYSDVLWARVTSHGPAQKIICMLTAR